MNYPSKSPRRGRKSPQKTELDSIRAMEKLAQVKRKKIPELYKSYNKAVRNWAIKVMQLTELEFSFFVNSRILSLPGAPRRIHLNPEKSSWLGWHQIIKYYPFSASQLKFATFHIESIPKYRRNEVNKAIEVAHMLIYEISATNKSVLRARDSVITLVAEMMRRRNEDIDGIYPHSVPDLVAGMPYLKALRKGQIPRRSLRFKFFREHLFNILPSRATHLKKAA